jgi:hypothetical protein
VPSTVPDDDIVPSMAADEITEKVVVVVGIGISRSLTVDRVVTAEASNDIGR